MLHLNNENYTKFYIHINVAFYNLFYMYQTTTLGNRSRDSLQAWNVELL